MSNPLVTLVYSKRVGSAARKAVLGYMADRANDDGANVYASKGRIARDTELSEASVKKAIREFIAEGLIREDGIRPCANGVTKVYAVIVDMVRALPGTNPEPRHPVTPSPSNPVVRCDPVTQEPPPRHLVTPTPSPGDPKPPRTTIEPKEDTSDEVSKKADPKPFDVLTEVASEKAAKSFIKYRIGIRKALTITAAVRIRNSLQLIRDQGGAPDDALGLAEERGWQSINPDWYFKDKSNGQRNQAVNEPTRGDVYRFADEIVSTGRSDPIHRDPLAPGASRRR